MWQGQFARQETYKKGGRVSGRNVRDSKSLHHLYLRKENGYEEKNRWSNYGFVIEFGTGMEYSGIN